MIEPKQVKLSNAQDLQDFLSEFHNHASSGKIFIKRAINIFSFELSNRQKLLVLEGARRYLEACYKTDIFIEIAPIREIIEDAKDYRQVWKESDNEFKNAIGKESPERFKEKIAI